MAERALTVRDVAAEYGVTPATVYALVKAGELPALRLPGGNLRFRRWMLPEALSTKRNINRIRQLTPTEKLLARAQAKASNAPGRDGFVYFIQEGSDGPIKIGTAINPHTRLKGLQSAHSRKLFLLGFVEGNFAVERELQRAFQSLRISGEWFRPTKRLLQFVAEAVAIRGSTRALSR